MRGVLLIIAAAVATSLSAPAAAQSGAGAGFSPSASASGQFSRSSDVRIHRGLGGRDRNRDSFGDFRRDDRDGRDLRGDTFLPYRDYQGDSLWRPDSFNDWWHDRPDRAYPRWLSTNAGCERMWWSGSGWRC